MTEPHLLLTRGIPASGKTTWAKAWVAEDPENRVRLNRDDLRAMLRPGATEFDGATEQLVTKLQHEGAKTALKAGKSVVIDDTNLRARYVREWYKVGPVQFKDFDVDLNEAIFRDLVRLPRVGESVIRSFHQRYIAANGGTLPPIPQREHQPGLEVEPYVPDDFLPHAIIVDTDGTVAKMNGRGPYDSHLVHTDLPVENVVNMVQLIRASGVGIIGVSGRDEGKTRDATINWWKDNGIPFDEFYFRPAGDTRRDDLVKLELFNEHIRDRFNVVGVFDDRLRVIRMWYQLGLTTYRVGDPDADF